MADGLPRLAGLGWFTLRAALSNIPVGGGPGNPDVEDWGEPGLTPAERVIGWNTLEVLSLAAANPDTPVNAIPGSAQAHCQLRFVVGTDAASLGTVLRAHLDQYGFSMVDVEPGHLMDATRSDPDGSWVRLALASLERTEGIPAALLPTSAAACPTTFSPMDWASPPYPIRIPTRPVPSMRPTSTCWPR